MDHKLTKPFSNEPKPYAVPSSRTDSAWITSIKGSTVAQGVVALGTMLAICYFAKLVWITLMVGALVAFMLEPIVLVLEKRGTPRPLGAFLAVLLGVAITCAAAFFLYNRASAFITQLPSYASRIRGTFPHLERQTQKIEQTKEQILPKEEQKAVPVSVKDVGSLFTQLFGVAADMALTVGFAPFLIYFMLTWHRQAWTKTVKLFPVEQRDQVRDALAGISTMMRTFIVGNFVIGIALSVVSVAVFGALHLPYFYFLGFISGFLSLVPYLGAILAVAIPVAAGIGVLHTTGMLIVVVAVVVLHLFALNVLYPKLIGARVELNPLIVVVGLLFWGWMWGAMGLILAIPIMAAIKIICDHVGGLQAIGEWMGTN